DGGHRLLGHETIREALDEVRDGLAAGAAIHPRSTLLRFEDTTEQRIARWCRGKRRQRSPGPTPRQRHTSSVAIPHQWPLRNRRGARQGVKYPRALKYFQDKSLSW